mgnify:CR=1 FL=1
METLTVEYVGEDGLQIVRISEKKYYFGDGETLNAIGISPNQFLRFHPYMNYVAGKGMQPTDKIKAWIKNNV